MSSIENYIQEFANNQNPSSDEEIGLKLYLN
jgi:hypothetical protein